MISVNEAREIILGKIQKLESEILPILEALGRVLDEDVLAEADIPPFNNSAMDGYAVRAVDVVGVKPDNPVELKVIGDIAAGYVPERSIGPGETIRIMTGAQMPEGADAVIMQEYTERFSISDISGSGIGDNAINESTDKSKTANGRSSNDGVRIMRETEEGGHIRFAGEDIRLGEVALEKGKRLTPACIGVLASVGRATVKVIRKPVVAIIATGDELVDLDEPLQPGKIRNSNGYSIAALALDAGCTPWMLGIAKDTHEHLMAKVEEATKADLIITTGGVSVGDYDFVKDILDSAGEMVFWQVNMKPGKPLAFGMVKGTPLIGLPGYPTSSMVSFDQFARPALLKMSGRTDLLRMTVEAVSEVKVKNKSGRTNYVRVIVRQEEETFKVRLSGMQKSGSLKPMTMANGLMIVPDDMPEVNPGDKVKVELFEPITE